MRLLRLWRWILKSTGTIRCRYGLFAVFLMLNGCSSFNRAWNAAGSAPADSAASPIAGRWIGTWSSDVNGHHDQLRCLVTRATNEILSARFHARYKKAFIRFSFGYTALLTVRTNDERIEFAGEADL